MFLLIKKIYKNIKNIDAQTYVDQVVFVVLFLGVLHIVLGLLARILQLEVLRVLGLGALSFLVLGVLPVLLSFGIRKYSYVALLSVLFIYSLDVGISVYSIIVSKEFVLYLLIKIIVLLFVFKGFKAIKIIKAISLR